MSYSEIIINGSPVKLIPLGDCACGCGGKTKINKQNNRYHGHIVGEPRKFILGHNTKLPMHNHRWGNGESTNRGRKTLNKRHILGIDEPGSKYEHTVICEKALGKPLPLKAVVHHHTLKQLVVCQDNGYHMLLHQRTRALSACGCASWRKCRICQQYDNPKNLIIYPGKDVIHRECLSNYDRKRKHRKKQG